MKDRYFLDTNIFVYSFDDASRAKQKKAKRLIEQALATGLGIVSYQVVQEFTNVSLNKFKKPLSAQDCVLYLESVLLPLCDFYPGRDFYIRSVAVQVETGYSYYDALIIGAALESNCQILYSEDMQDGRQLSKKLRIANPFAVGGMAE